MNRRAILLSDDTSIDPMLVQAPVPHVIEIDAAIAKLANEHVDAVHVEPGSVTGYQREIARLLLRYRIPAVSELRLLVEFGGLFSYGPNLFEVQDAWYISWTES